MMERSHAKKSKRSLCTLYINRAQLQQRAKPVPPPDVPSPKLLVTHSSLTMVKNILNTPLHTTMPIDLEHIPRDELIRAVRMLENVNQAQATTIGLYEERVSELEGRNRDLNATLTRREAELNRVRWVFHLIFHVTSSYLFSNTIRSLQSNSQRNVHHDSAGPVLVGSGPATSAAPLPSQPASGAPISPPVPGAGNVVPPTHSHALPTPPRTRRNSASPEPRNIANPMPQGATPRYIPADRRLRRQYVCPVASDRRLVRQGAFYEPREDRGELERRMGINPSDSGVERFQKMLDSECAAVQRAKTFAGRKRSRAEAAEDEGLVEGRSTRRSGAPAPSPPAPSSNPPADSTPSVPTSSGTTIPAPGESSRSSKRRRLSTTDTKTASGSGPRKGDRDSDSRKKRKH
jgi:hypothetical protein